MINDKLIQMAIDGYSKFSPKDMICPACGYNYKDSDIAYFCISCYNQLTHIHSILASIHKLVTMGYTTNLDEIKKRLMLYKLDGQ